MEKNELKKYKNIIKQGLSIREASLILKIAPMTAYRRLKKLRETGDIPCFNSFLPFLPVPFYICRNNRLFLQKKARISKILALKFCPICFFFYFFGYFVKSIAISFDSKCTASFCAVIKSANESPLALTSYVFCPRFKTFPAEFATFHHTDIKTLSLL